MRRTSPPFRGTSEASAVSGRHPRTTRMSLGGGDVPSGHRRRRIGQKQQSRPGQTRGHDSPHRRQWIKSQPRRLNVAPENQSEHTPECPNRELASPSAPPRPRTRAATAAGALVKNNKSRPGQTRGHDSHRAAGALRSSTPRARDRSEIAHAGVPSRFANCPARPIVPHTSSSSEAARLDEVVVFRSQYMTLGANFRR